MPSSVTTRDAQPGPLRLLWLRFEHLVRELGKFGIVGGSTFLLDTLVFNLFLGTVPGLWAKVISTGVSASAAFVGNRYWTWRDRPRTALHREYLLYFVFNAVGLGIAEACWWISNHGLGHFWPEVFHTRLADNISTQLIGTVMGTLFRFWGYRRFVFPAGEAGEPAEAVEAGTDGDAGLTGPAYAAVEAGADADPPLRTTLGLVTGVDGALPESGVAARTGDAAA